MQGCKIKVENNVDAEICDVVVDNVNNDAKLTIFCLNMLKTPVIMVMH